MRKRRKGPQGGIQYHLYLGAENWHILMLLPQQPSRFILDHQIPFILLAHPVESKWCQKRDTSQGRSLLPPVVDCPSRCRY